MSMFKYRLLYTPPTPPIKVGQYSIVMAATYVEDSLLVEEILEDSFVGLIGNSPAHIRKVLQQILDNIEENPVPISTPLHHSLTRQEATPIYEEEEEELDVVDYFYST